MKKSYKILIIIGVILFILFIIFAGMYGFVKGKYNSMVIQDEGVKTAWANVENQYQRRYDLIPNLVKVVKQYAKHESETLKAVTQARSKMGGVVNIDKSVINNPKLMAKYQQMQSSLGGMLQRLMVVSERYPNLKANQNFRDLQVQLEGTENKIAVERRRYNIAVKNFNIVVRTFPNNMFANMFGFKPAVPYKMDKEAAKAPKVDFGK